LAHALPTPAGSHADAPPPLSFDDSAPQRRCVATGRTEAQDALIRFVLDPAGVLVPDLDHKLPGRGFYVAADPAALDLALKKKSFARAARQPVTVPADLGTRLDALLVARCQQLIGLARRAGQTVAGHDRVVEWLKGGRAALLLQAADGSEAGRAKLAGTAHGLPHYAVLSAAELASPFGRDHIVHVALAAGGLARRLQPDLSRLKGLRARATLQKAQEA
jgi:predicted RNA-binding protein YlxR (DUF448 family)